MWHGLSRIEFPYCLVLLLQACIAHGEGRSDEGFVSAQYDKKTIANSIGIKLVRIEPGKFKMGAAAGDADALTDEFQHEVEISRAFYIGVTEVTQAQFEAVMSVNPSRIKGKDLPVENITWMEAKEFCQKLSKKEGKSYRLPTEAEWEYSCRAGSSKPYYDSDILTHKQANFFKNGTSRGATVAVGNYPANKWGLHDMLGNVWDMCEDWYSEDYYKKSPKRDPQGPAMGKDRVLRGGSCGDGVRYCRASTRYHFDPALRSSAVGFRVALLP
jgi:formylglycine-generating enzyme required for sulfatase activity